MPAVPSRRVVRHLDQAIDPDRRPPGSPVDLRDSREHDALAERMTNTAALCGRKERKYGCSNRCSDPSPDLRSASRHFVRRVSTRQSHCPQIESRRGA